MNFELILQQHILYSVTPKPTIFSNQSDQRQTTLIAKVACEPKAKDNYVYWALLLKYFDQVKKKIKEVVVEQLNYDRL